MSVGRVPTAGKLVHFFWKLFAIQLYQFGRTMATLAIFLAVTFGVADDAYANGEFVKGWSTAIDGVSVDFGSNFHAAALAQHARYYSAFGTPTKFEFVHASLYRACSVGGAGQHYCGLAQLNCKWYLGEWKTLAGCYKKLDTDNGKPQCVAQTGNPINLLSGNQN